MQYTVLIVTIYCHAVQLYSVLMERYIYTISEIEQQRYTALKVGHNDYNTVMLQPCPTRPVVTSGVDSDLEEDSQESIYKVSGVLRLERLIMVHRLSTESSCSLLKSEQIYFRPYPRVDLN